MSRPLDLAVAAFRSAKRSADVATQACKGVTAALAEDDADLDIRFQFTPVAGGLTPDDAVKLALHLMRDPETA